jgi:quinol monooxygenase YgiN
VADEPLAMVVEFRAAPGKVDELRAALLAIVGPSRAEEGCERYDLHIDREDPDVLAFYEVWASTEAHAAHDRTPHIEHLRTVLPALVADRRVLRLTRIEP